MFLPRLFVIDKYQKTILVSLSGILIQVSIRHTYNFSLFKKVIHLKVRQINYDNFFPRLLMGVMKYIIRMNIPCKWGQVFITFFLRRGTLYEVKNYQLFGCNSVIDYWIFKIVCGPGIWNNHVTSGNGGSTISRIEELVESEGKADSVRE